MNIDALNLSIHFMRPNALWLLGILPLLWWGLRRRYQAVDPWMDRIDPHLRPHVLEGATQSARSSTWPWLLGALLAIIALAGPAWRQLPQASWQNGRALVVALDLSSAINANDVPPSRLLQARAKLRQLLDARPDGLIALVAYAEDAHTVTPLTSDTANVVLFIDALSPEIMPVDGANPARAIEFSTQLLRQGGASEGDILLITGALDDDAAAAARQSAGKGYRVSTLGLGSAAGADVRDRDGTVRRVRLDAASLRDVAAAGGGRMAEITADDTDLRALGVLDAESQTQSLVRGKRGLAWQDEGYWLLLPLMLLALLAFRRRAVSMVLMAVLAGSLMVPDVAHAQNASTSRSWWLRDDQQQHRLMQSGHQAYREGDYARAAEAYQRVPGADAQYNLGNALAKAGRYDEAIAAYDQAIKINPALPDVQENRAAVEQARKRKPPAGSKQQQQQQQQQQQAKPSQQNQDQGAGTDPKSEPTKPIDPTAQQAAEQAQREQMARELAARKAGEKSARPAGTQRKEDKAETQAEREKREAVEAWLRRVPDTPGDWLRQKFWIEYQRRRMGEDQ